MIYLEWVSNNKHFNAVGITHHDSNISFNLKQKFSFTKMFVLILTIFVSKSFSSSIRLSEPLVVKTQDGQKYLYHPKLKPAYEKREQFGNTDYEESKHGCSWSKWGDFSACKPFGKKLNSLKISFL